MMELLQTQPNTKADLFPILERIRKQYGLLIERKKDTELSIVQAIATLNHVKAGTNGLFRMKQSLEKFLPDLKG